jgi:cysteine desulfurase
VTGYLDANASEPLRPAARAAALRAMELANPSSIHAEGRWARRALEDARETVAGYFGAASAQVIFTSGATEANALAIASLGAGRPVLVGATEHAAVREAAISGVEIPVTAAGVVDLGGLEELLRRNRPALVCLMAANNETGVLHDLREAARLCATYGARLHVDAVQAVGRLALDWAGLGAASLAISGHKIGGPMGAGALILAPGLDVAPMLRGGGQEHGRRGGTPALPAIVGMAAALGADYDAARMAALRDAIEAAAGAAGAVVMGGAAPRLPNTSCLALPGVAAQTQLIALDLAGFSVSAGAACSSGKVAFSHVLAAMGQGALASQSVRVSLPWTVADDVVPAFGAAYATMARRARMGQKAALNA